jgi:hypothetical protein
MPFQRFTGTRVSGETPETAGGKSEQHKCCPLGGLTALPFFTAVEEGTAGKLRGKEQKHPWFLPSIYLQRLA